MNTLIWPAVIKYTLNLTTSNTGKNPAPSITWISSQEKRNVNNSDTNISQEQERDKTMSNDVDLTPLIYTSRLRRASATRSKVLRVIKVLSIVIVLSIIKVYGGIYLALLSFLVSQFKLSLKVLN